MSRKTGNVPEGVLRYKRLFLRHQSQGLIIWIGKLDHLENFLSVSLT